MAGEPVVVVAAEGVGVALLATAVRAGDDAGPAPTVLGWADGLREIERRERGAGPRWVWWGKATARALVDNGIRPARCFDLGAVHRLLAGRWRADPARVWANAHELDPDSIPVVEPVTLFTQPDADADPDQPIRPDGHLRPDWAAGAWADTPERLAAWATLATDTYHRQLAQLAALPNELRPRGLSPRLQLTAYSESAAELLCAELEADGLPVDVDEAERIIGGIVGPRPRSADDAAAQVAHRDHDVLRHLPAGSEFDLRNPAQVKSLLRRAGIEVPDTRAWRLERHRDDHPVVEALLRWRKAERIATTFGYGWLDEHVRDGRLRGEWAGADGAAGRMTATAGLHNMPTDLRPAIAAAPGHRFVRADLGQIEPRVLAAVSGDETLARATQDDDLYLPVARRLGVDRDVAKVAVLGAMYGQKTGRGAEALAGLEAAYPVAMAYLHDAARHAEAGRDLRTYGGRRIRMSANTADSLDGDDPAGRDARSRAAARGRYGRNAMVQGAAAELFKTWAVLVRARGAPLGARIVLCLHDELLVHTAAESATAVAALVDDCLQEAVHRWAPDGADVRFLADTTVIDRWSDAK